MLTKISPIKNQDQELVAVAPEAAPISIDPLADKIAERMQDLDTPEEITASDDTEQSERTEVAIPPTVIEQPKVASNPQIKLQRVSGEQPLIKNEIAAVPQFEAKQNRIAQVAPPKGEDTRLLRSQYEKRIEELERALSDSERLVSELTKRPPQFEDAKSEAEISALKNTIAELEAALDTAPIQNESELAEQLRLARTDARRLEVSQDKLLDKIIDYRRKTKQLRSELTQVQKQGATLQSNQTAMQTLEQRNKNLEKQISELKTQFDGTRNKQIVLSKDLNNAKQEAVATKEELAKIAKKLEQANKENRDLNSELATQKSKLAKLPELERSLLKARNDLMLKSTEIAVLEEGKPKAVKTKASTESTRRAPVDPRKLSFLLQLPKMTC